MVDGFMESGNHVVIFNGSNLASGIYLYRFKSKDFQKTGKLLLVR